jgi:NTE family protein
MRQLTIPFGRRAFLISAALAAIALELSSCGVIPYETSRNEAQCIPHTRNCLPSKSGSRDPLHPVPRARSEFQYGDRDVPDVFVGLALSGGGSRSANFSLAVMEQLNEIGLLKHATAISSTSGGGLAGAYYALKGPELNWGDARKRMSTNFLNRWILRNLYPHKILQTTFTHADRSDVMAEVFDEVLFDGKTYRDLGELGPGRPKLIANATNSSTGERFSFTEEVFSRMLRSRLDTYPLSRAVMASGAFPGAFNSVTLTRYPPLQRLPKTPEIPLGYVHLIDGGPADNLGLEQLLGLAASHHRVKQEVEKHDGMEDSDKAKFRSSNACFLFVVDAHPLGVASRKAWQADPRGLADFWVDLNFLDAFDALLARRRADLLATVGVGTRTPGSGRYIGDGVQPVAAPGLSGDLILPIDKLVQIDIPISFTPGQPLSAQVRQVGTVSKLPDANPSRPAKGYFRCTAWHLNLSGLLSVRPYVGTLGHEPQRLERMTDYDHPLIHHRIRLNRIVSQIDTNYKLKGPKHCSTQMVQDALYAAAFVAVREDHSNRTSVCNWFRTAGLAVADSCNSFPGNKTLESLNLSGIRASGPVVADRPGDQLVECASDSS